MKSNILKKICVFCIVFVCFISAHSAYAAESNTYSLPELKLNISVDDTMNTITRETPKSDPVFDSLGVNYENTMLAFKNSDVYMQSISADSNYMLTVSMSATDSSASVVSYSRLSAEERAALKDEFLGNSIYTSAQVTDIGGHYYIVLPFEEKQDGVTIYGIQYNTVENGQNINITLQTSLAPLTGNSISIIADAVNSIEFTDQTQKISVFHPAAVAAIAALAIIAVIILLTVFSKAVRKKNSAAFSDNGFDIPEKSPIYSRRTKKRERKLLEQEQRRKEAREQAIENIDSGEAYNVFRD